MVQRDQCAENAARGKDAEVQDQLYNQPGRRTKDECIKPPKTFSEDLLFCLYYLRVNKRVSLAKTSTYSLKNPNSYRQYYYTESNSTVLIGLSIGMPQLNQKNPQKMWKPSILSLL